MNEPTVEAVHLAAEHTFSKSQQRSIQIVAGIGVAGDAHAGEKVQHLSRVRADPDQPNLRQVHLIHAELFEQMARQGYKLEPGDLGENITTRHLDLLALGRDTLLTIGNSVLRVTGLRNPCAQIDAFAPGLLKHLAFRRGDEIVRKAGIMTVAEVGGTIRAGDTIIVRSPTGPHVPLERV